MKQIIKNMRMNPRAEIEMVHAETVGLFGGQVPFVLVRLNSSKVVKLYTGQVIPVGMNYRIINPFQRTLDVQIILNAPVNLSTNWQGFAASDKHEITYFLSEKHNIRNNGLGRGVMIHQATGSSFIDIQYSSDVDVEIIRDWGQAEMAARPVGVMDNSPDAVHTSLDINERLLIQSGYFDVVDFATYLRHDGRTDDPVVVNRNALYWQGFLPQGSTLLIRGGIDIYLEYNMEITDCGVDNYDE